MRSIVVILFLTFLSSASEAFGIGIFYPIFQFISSDGNIDLLVADSALWSKMLDFSIFLGFEISLVILLATAFLLFISRQFILYIRAVYQARLSSYLQKMVRSRMFSRYLTSDTSHQETYASGGLVNIMINEIPGAVSAIMIPIEFATLLVMLIIYASMLFLISPEMTLLSSFVFILASYIPRKWIRQSKNVSIDLVNINTVLSTFIANRFRSPRLIRLSGSEKFEIKRFNNLVEDQRENNVKASILTNRTEMVMEPVVILMSLSFLYIAHNLLSLSIELIGLYMLVSMRLLPIVKGIIERKQQIMSAFGPLEIVKSRFDKMKESFEENNGLLDFNKNFLEIKFQNVSYRYLGHEHYAINDISIAIRSGEITAIVGPSGGGKSTLIDLLPRLRLPQKGSIFIDRDNINKFEINKLRSEISYVSQTPQMFEGSILDHIKYGSPDISYDKVKEASKLAGASNFIEKLPQRYESMIEDGAVKLSGGQRQRLDLARALAGDSKILILDEPTSNLDFESSENFNMMLSSICERKDKTIIIVSHNLLSISNSDQIIVLKNGKVDCAGNHNYLLKNSDWYSKAFLSKTTK
jgi:ABC-type multidrug transport system fused ATPase/permease subunit